MTWWEWLIVVVVACWVVIPTVLALLAVRRDRAVEGPLMTVTEADVLDRAADLVAEGWTQEAFARDESGVPVGPSSALACSWCLIGGLVRAANDLGAGCAVYDGAYDRLGANGRPPFASNQQWNDAPERTQAEVVAVLREAARQARQEAKG